MFALSERRFPGTYWKRLRLRTKLLIGGCLMAAIIGAVWLSGVSILDRQGQPGTASRIVVGARGDLQRSLNLAKPGDTIILEAGAVFTGPFTLPFKRGAGYITIQSSRLSELPKDKRVSPSNAALMPKLVSPGSNQPVIYTAPSAHHYQFIGIEIAPVNATVVVSDLIKLGDGNQTSLDAVAHDLILDRCYIHGFPTQDVKRGVALNSGEASIINSYISDIHGIGYDTQAICGWNGPGPYHIINNYLEAAGENLMFGGADPAVLNLVPADIEIRRNTFFKPLSWRVGDPAYGGHHWTVKNLLELKNSRRVVIDGNTFENTWVDAQVGFALLIKSQNQDGNCPWCVTEEVTVSNNIIRNVENGINVLAYDPYHPSAQLKHLRIVNNLWVNVRGMWFQGTDGADDLLLEHNTHLQQSGNVMTLYGRPTTNFVYRHNITIKSGYGVKGDGMEEGLPTLRQYCPAYVFEKNVIAGASEGSYPPNNFYPGSLAEVRFVSPEKGDYRLSGPSRYRAAGSDKRDLGCDLDALYAAMSKP
jgi:hypothetical protein